MDVKSKGIALTTVVFFLGFSAIFPLCFSAANQPRNSEKPTRPASAVFPVQGNVYPLGYVYSKLFDCCDFRLIILFLSSYINLLLSITDSRFLFPFFFFFYRFNRFLVLAIKFGSELCSYIISDLSAESIVSPIFYCWIRRSLGHFILTSLFLSFSGNFRILLVCIEFCLTIPTFQLLMHVTVRQTHTHTHRGTFFF